LLILLSRAFLRGVFFGLRSRSNSGGDCSENGRLYEITAREWHEFLLRAGKREAYHAAGAGSGSRLVVRQRAKKIQIESA
jgi:hypothetical protein